MHIAAFVLEVVFQWLVGAALLRAWMNGLRVNMRVQPGIFVMALTDWIVKPLRRWLLAPEPVAATTNPRKGRLALVEPANKDITISPSALAWLLTHSTRGHAVDISRVCKSGVRQRAVDGRLVVSCGRCDVAVFEN
jgi:hypothetical protein